MNFKPGDKVIYVGDGILPGGKEAPIGPGDEITLGDRVMPDHILRCGGDPKYAWFEVGEFGVSELYIRKPDDYDITTQEWYQRILRGEKLEETV